MNLCVYIFFFFEKANFSALVLEKLHLREIGISRILVEYERFLRDLYSRDVMYFKKRSFFRIIPYLCLL